MPPTFTLLRKNLWVRFGFGGASVLVASGGDPVSCYTPVGGAGSVIFDFLQSVSHTACDPTAIRKF